MEQTQLTQQKTILYGQLHNKILYGKNNLKRIHTDGAMAEETYTNLLQSMRMMMLTVGHGGIILQDMEPMDGDLLVVTGWQDLEWVIMAILLMIG